jgi:hypothetical protein
VAFVRPRHGRIVGGKSAGSAQGIVERSVARLQLDFAQVLANAFNFQMFPYVVFLLLSACFQLVLVSQRVIVRILHLSGRAFLASMFSTLVKKQNYSRSSRIRV